MCFSKNFDLSSFSKCVLENDRFVYDDDDDDDDNNNNNKNNVF